MATPVKTDEDPLRTMETYNSQDFVEYLNEIRHIRRDSDETADDDVPPEEGEDELEWLKQTGFDLLLSVPEPGSEVPSSEVTEEWTTLNTLSTRQAEVVKRRVNTLRDTMRKRKTREKGRRPDMRHLFPAEGASSSGGGARSRSATPDSLDSLSPPLTPPDACSRLEAGSPHSQGYHSSSRGSLDQLEHGADEEKERQPEFRHVLRIRLEQEPPEPAVPPAVQPAVQPAVPLAVPPAVHPADVQLWRKSPDSTDRAHKALSLFETSKHYKLKRMSAPANSSGIELVSLHQIGSLSRQPEKLTPSLGELGELRIPRVRSGSKSEGAANKEADKTTQPDSLPYCRAALEGNLGRTLIDYLSEPDAKRIQKLALIELTALFDENGLSYTRRKARRKRLRARASTADVVFGASLTTLLERDRQRSPDCGDVPLLLERVLLHLERRGVSEEGLLRVPGHQHKVELLRREVDEHFYSQPGAVEAALQRSSAADVAALVKLFLRELPRPLLTYECMDAFQRTDALRPDRQPTALSLLCLQLPAPNRAVLRRLLSFLAIVVEREQLNKMSLENVSMIMAPNLMWPAQRRQKEISAEIEFAAATSRVVRGLIRHRGQLWDVPADFVRQLRRQRDLQAQERARKEPSRPVREMKKLLPMRKAKDTPVVRRADHPEDIQDGVMRVSAPQLTTSCWPVTLAPDNSAGHLVAWCCQQIRAENAAKPSGRRGSSPKLDDSFIGGTASCLAGDLSTILQSHYLYEYGGNIESRRIEHDAALLDCFHENRSGRWVIECCHPSQHVCSVEIVAD